MRFLSLILVLATWPLTLLGQETIVPAQATPTPGEQMPPGLREAMAALVNSIRRTSESILSAQEELQVAQTNSAREEIQARIRALEGQREQQRLDLLDLSTDVDLSGFEATQEQAFSLQASIEQLIRPLIDEFKRATADSREEQAIQTQFEEAKEQEDVIRQALNSLDGVITRTNNPSVIEELSLVRETWQGRHAKLRDEVNVLGFRLDQLAANDISFVDKTRGAVASFFRVRGRNLLLALAAGTVVFVAMRMLEGTIRRRSPTHRGVRSFGARLFDVLFAVFSVLFAVLAIVLVFFAVGDWVLLGLIVLIFAAAVLTAKDAIPKFVDDARMLLNLGPVREGERITYDGVPWVVEDLTFFTILRNPALRGGMLRMPVARLHDMLSRPMGPDEPFFPCEEGDWVLLDDETYGRSVFQSPEMVQLELLGGAQRTYPTSEFLEQNPRNHSHGFRVSTTFGIDYDHQEQCTSETLEQLRSFFKTAVEEIVPADQLRSLKVEFASASASSLDYDILLDVTGDLAPKFNPLQRALQRIGVDACNKFGLVIPFQQLTVHNSNEPRE